MITYIPLNQPNLICVAPLCGRFVPILKFLKIFTDFGGKYIKISGDHGIKWGGKTLLDLYYADDLSILDESVSKMNEVLEVLRVQGAKIGLKINVKKTKSLRLGISEDEQVTLGNEKIDQVGSFSYLGSIISKDGGSSEDVKSRIAKAQGVFSQLKKRFGRIER